jgi:hypothetical protein
MRRSCLGIAGALLAFSLAGCGESSEEGPITYKGTDSPAIQQLRDDMAKNAKNKTATTKGAEPKPDAKPTMEKVADKKPSGDAAPEKPK